MTDRNTTVEKLQGELLSGSQSPSGVATEYLEVIEERDKTLHAYLTVDRDDVLLQARLLEEEGVSDRPLYGIPIAIKDNMCVLGTKTTAASKMLSNYTATYDAFVIERLREAGAIIVGKTNMDEFAMGSSTENSAFGATKNPHNEERVPGGSSGGSAAAVAAGMCAVALGSDTGGSIRQPASFCGIVGLKPTYGAVSRSGLIAMASSLDQIGPLANSVRDAEIIFDVIRGKDSKDATSVDADKGPPKPDHKWRIGVPKEYFGEGLDPAVKKMIMGIVAELASNGVEVKEISLPNSPYALAAYYIIMPAEVSSNLARLDGVRYGHHVDAPTLLESYLKSRTEGFGRETRRRIILGTHVLSSGYYDEFYGRAQRVRTLVKKDFDIAFESVDAIVTPTAPTTAFRIGEKTSDPLTMYLSDVYTVPVNLAGLPALSLPAGKIDGLPVGLQLIGRAFEEKWLFQFGSRIEELTRGA